MSKSIPKETIRGVGDDMHCVQGALEDGTGDSSGDASMERD